MRLADALRCASKNRSTSKHLALSEADSRGRRSPEPTLSVTKTARDRALTRRRAQGPMSPRKLTAQHRQTPPLVYLLASTLVVAAALAWWTRPASLPPLPPTLPRGRRPLQNELSSSSDDEVEGKPRNQFLQLAAAERSCHSFMPPLSMYVCMTQRRPDTGGSTTPRRDWPGPCFSW